MLAAIGKQFSGYKFFVQKGLLTEEEKQQNAAANQTNNSKHNKKQRQRRHNKKCATKNTQQQQHLASHIPRVNISMPSFKDEQLSQRSGIVSNCSHSFEDTSPIQYVDHPSWHSHQFDSHNSQSTVLSGYNSFNAVPQPQPQPQPTPAMPAFRRQSKSLHANWRMPAGYHTPQPQQHHVADPNRYRSYSMNNTYSSPVPSYYPVTPQPNMAYYPPKQQQAHSVNNMNRSRTQSMGQSQYYNNAMYASNNQQTNKNLVSFAQLNLPPRNHHHGYSLSPQLQPRQAQACFAVPPMKQSISYNHLERSLTRDSSHSPQSVNSFKRGGLQQQSAPRLPSPKHHLTPPYKPKKK
eukprot:1028970_1